MFVFCPRDFNRFRLCVRQHVSPWGPKKWCHGCRVCLRYHHCFPSPVYSSFSLCFSFTPPLNLFLTCFVFWRVSNLTAWRGTTCVQTSSFPLGSDLPFHSALQLTLVQFYTKSARSGVLDAEKSAQNRRLTPFWLPVDKFAFSGVFCPLVCHNQRHKHTGQ